MYISYWILPLCLVLGQPQLFFCIIPSGRHCVSRVLKENRSRLMFATMVLYALSAAVMSVFFPFLSILVVWERERDDRVQCCSTLLCSHVSPAHNGALCIDKKPMCLQKTETWEPSVKVQSWSAPHVTYLLVMTQERDVSFDSAVTSPCAIFLSFERMVCSSCSGCLNNSMLRLGRCVHGQALL